MLRRFHEKIEYLRQQPEEVRLKAVIRYTVIGGIVVLVLWLAIFLPLQLNFF